MRNKNNSYIPFLIILFFIIIILIIIFTIVFGKTDDSYRNDHLDNIDYKYDKNYYYKNMTNNTLDDFYQLVNSKQEASFLEYKYETTSNTFYEKKLDYSNNLISSLTFGNFISNNYIRILYELSTNNSNIIISGIYYEETNNLSCNIDSTNNYTSNINLNVYCDTISNNIDDFILERNNFVTDKRFTNILNKDYSNVVIGEG